MKAKTTMLRLTRESKSETITSMANKLKIGISRYYMIEIGERPASCKIAKQIADILKVKQEDIFLPRTFTAREMNDHHHKAVNQ